MSVTEILEELPKLNMEERHLLIDRLAELEIDQIEETPEMLQAVAEGIRSIEEHGGILGQTVRARFEAKWPAR